MKGNKLCSYCLENIATFETYFCSLLHKNNLQNNLINLTTEVYRPIPDFPDYGITISGNIKNLITNYIFDINVNRFKTQNKRCQVKLKKNLIIF
jgi:hypothetical protein